MSKGLMERLADGPVLGDGGYLLELEKRGYVRGGPFTPEVSLTCPEALIELHREFLQAGAEVLQALTFYASEDKLRTVGLGVKVDDINRAAVRCARAAVEANRSDSLVAGNLSLTSSSSYVYDTIAPAPPTIDTDLASPNPDPHPTWLDYRKRIPELFTQLRHRFDHGDRFGLAQLYESNRRRWCNHKADERPRRGRRSRYW